VRLAYLMTSSPTAAEDVVQDAVVATSRRWSTIDDPDPYLRRAVVNRARSAHRTTGRERAKVDRLGGVAAPVALEPSIDETWAVLRRLPDRQRQALVLRFYEDLPDAEIADLLGCRPAVVRSTGGAEDHRPPAARGHVRPADRARRRRGRGHDHRGAAAGGPPDVRRGGLVEAVWCPTRRPRHAPRGGGGEDHRGRGAHRGRRWPGTAGRR
jgi:RNA polymerase sigma factor (sigma-70 family)